MKLRILLSFIGFLLNSHVYGKYLAFFERCDLETDFCQLSHPIPPDLPFLDIWCQILPESILTGVEDAEVH
jgi:hypothetical protein